MPKRSWIFLSVCLRKSHTIFGPILQTKKQNGISERKMLRKNAIFLEWDSIACQLSLHIKVNKGVYCTQYLG